MIRIKYNTDNRHTVVNVQVFWKQNGKVVGLLNWLTPNQRHSLQLTNVSKILVHDLACSMI